MPAIEEIASNRRPKEDESSVYSCLPYDREIVRLLKRHPIILEGSRGTGKSFLLRVAEMS